MSGSDERAAPVADRLTGEHVMTEESAGALLERLTDHRVDPCVGGGWAVDALLGEQTREHSDLDLWVEATRLEPLFLGLTEFGVDRVFPWPGDRPWNFVLHDGAHLRVDVHLYEQLTPASWHYGGVSTGKQFPSSALAGRGTIIGRQVRCEAPEWAVRWHTGYVPRRVDHHDVPLLCSRFGLDLPAPYQ